MQYAASTLLLFGLVVTCQTCCGEQIDSQVNPSTRFGNRIAEVHSAMTETRYSHSTQIDTENGVLICDCSGLIGFMLREEFPEHYVSLHGTEQPTRRRPLAVTFHETFTSDQAQEPKGAQRGAWESVPSLVDAQPGDILAWRKKVIKKGETTGHVCMIAAAPERVGDDLVKVQLIDSTRSPHENDTRPKGTDGVGSGHRFFVVDSDGRPIGMLTGSKRNASNIAVGRMTPMKFNTIVSADQQFLSLPKAEAVELAQTNGMSWQIIREDGEPQPMNWTIDEERLSFVVVDGKIQRVLRG